MNDRYDQTRYHPTVEAFLGTEPDAELILEALKAIPPPRSKIESALIALSEVSLGRRQIGEIKEEVEAAHEEQTDPNLYIIFLIAWFRAIFAEGSQWHLARFISQRLSSLITKDTPATLIAWTTFLIASAKFHMGDVAGSERQFEALPTLLSPQSPHYPRLMALRAVTYLQQGRGTIVEPYLVNILERMDHGQVDRLQFYRFIDLSITGAVDSAVEVVSDRSGSAGPEPFLLACQLPVASYVVRLMANYQGKAQVLPKLLLDLTSGPDPAWVSSTKALLNNSREEALDYARRYLNEVSVRRRTIVGFDEYALIRAELAMGHGEAAKHLLRKRHEEGSTHYVDDLFVARAELLTGDKDAALIHFSAFRKAVQRYNAQGRFDFECNLAKELSASQLIELTVSSDRMLASPSAVKRPNGGKESDAKQPVVGVNRIIQASPQLERLREMILDVATVDVPVLIVGETGTGKELVAKAIHESGPRAHHPFLEVNCGALSENLIESELFGHKRGAFTGAESSEKGLFREAGQGTIFLDEIGEISPKLQVALLRVLETREIRPVGSSEKFEIRCRVIAATNANLAQLAREGSFRSDLLYRLQRLELRIPPLRDRPEDIEKLSLHFLNIGRNGGKLAGLSEQLLAQLRSYPWPGNVRELRNVIERMRVLNSDKSWYDVGDFELPSIGREAEDPVRELPPPQHLPPSPTELKRVPEQGSLAPVVFDSEQRILLQQRSALRRVDRLRELFLRFNKLKVGEVAQLLEVSRVTASKYITALQKEGLVVKITPNSSRNSHYFQIVRMPKPL